MFGKRVRARSKASSPSSKKKVSKQPERRLAFEELEARELYAIRVWDGGGVTANWSDAANWENDAAVAAGDSLWFKDTGLQRATVNDLSAGTQFDSVWFFGSGYNITGNAVSLTNWVNSMNTAGSNSLDLDIAFGNSETIVGVEAGASLTLSGNLSGSGNFTKQNGGLLTLSGVNSLSGTTKGIAGTLVFAGGFSVADNAALTVAAGATLDFSASNETVGQVYAYAGSSIVLGSSTLTIGNNNPTELMGSVSGSGGIFKRGSSWMDLAGTNTFTGGVHVAEGYLNVDGAAAIASNANISIDYGAQASFLSSTTIGSLTTSQGSTINLYNSAIVTIGGDNSSSIVASNIAGTGGITKEGSGTLTLSGTNTYTGLTRINHGTLSLTGGSSIADTASIALANAADARLQVSAFSETIGGISGGGSLGGNVDITGNLTVNSGSVATFAGNISGTGALIKQGSGLLTLSGINTYTGATTVSGGTVNLSGGNAIWDNGLVSVAGSASLTLLSNETIGNLSGAANSNVNLGANTLTVGDGANSTFAGSINGTGGVNKQGTGALTLSGVNYYTGPTNINAGTLILSGGSALTDAGSVVLGAAGSLDISTSNEAIGRLSGSAGSSILLGARTLTLGDSVSTAFAGNITGTGGIKKVGTGGLTLSGTNTYSGLTFVLYGSLTVSGGSAIADSSAVSLQTGTSLTLLSDETVGSIYSPNSNAAINLNGNTLTAGGDNTSTTFWGAISGTGGLTKVGTGTLSLGGTNTYTGATNINGGKLYLSSGSAIVDTGEVVLANVAGAALELNGNGEHIGSISGGGSLGGNVIMGGSLWVTSDRSTTFGGSFIGAVNPMLQKLGAGTLTLTGVSNFTGSVEVYGGTLALAVDNAFATGVSLRVDQGGTVALGSHSLTTTYLNVINGNITGTGTLTNLNNIGVYAGSISANLATNVGVYKGGSSTFVLSGTNSSLNGNINLTAGTLTLAGGNAAGNTMTAYIWGGATLNVAANETMGSITGVANSSITLGANTLTSGDATSTTFAGTISGTGGFTKTGSGVLTFSGTNTYTGATTIGGGTLKVTSGTAIADTSAVSVASGATLNLTANETVGSLAGAVGSVVSMSANNLTVGADGTTTTYAGSITGSGALTKIGGGVQTLSGANTFTGTTQINGGTLALAGGSALVNTAAVTVNGGATADFSGGNEEIGQIYAYAGSNITIGASELTVSSNNASTLSGSIGGTGSIHKLGSGSLYLAGVNAFSGVVHVAAGSLNLSGGFSLGDTGSILADAGANVSFLSNETIGSILAAAGSVINLSNGAVLTTGGDNSSFNVSGVIAGSGGITKEGTGSFTLAGVNSYTGLTTVNGGTLLLAGGSAIADSASVSVSAGATLSLLGNETIGSLVGASGSVVNLYSYGLTVAGSSSNIFAGVISGTGGLTKQGTGTLTLSGVNTYTGQTSINGGTLALGVSNAIASNYLSVDQGGVFALGGFDEAIFNVTLASGSITGTGGTLSSLTAFVVKSGTISANLAGGGVGLIKDTAGTVVLSGVNTFSGGAGVNAGTLTLSGGAALSDASFVNIATGATLNLQSSEAIGDLNGNTNSYVTLGANTLTINNVNPNDYGYFLGNISGTGGITKQGASRQYFAGVDTYTGATTINGGTLQVTGGAALSDSTAVILANSAGANLELLFNETIGSLSGGGASGGNVILGSPRTLTVGNASDTTFAGVIGGSGALTKVGSGKLTLAGANTYSYSTTIAEGTLAFGANNVLAGNVVVSGGTLDIGAYSDTVSGVTLNSGSIIGTGTLTSTTSFAVKSGTISAKLAGSGIGLTKDTSGTVVLSGANAYTGATTVSAGVLTLAGGAAIADAAQVTLSSGAALYLGANETIGGLAGSTGSSVVLGVNTLTVNSSSSTAFAGSIGGSGGLTKSGTGTLTLSGMNSYTGAATISGGTLQVIGGFAISDASAVSVASGATLALSSNETIGSLTGVAGSAVSLGASTLTVNASTTTTFAGVISGTGGLAKLGSGALTLSGANTYTGATTINAGVLRSSGGNAINNAGAISVGAGATFDLGGVSETIGALSGSGSITLGAGTLTVGSTASSTFSGAIFGTGGLTKVGTGTLTLTGANTYTGATTINTGTLLLSGGVAIADVSAITVNAGGTLSLLTYETLASLTGAAGSFVTLGGSLTLASSSSTTYAGNISGSGGLTISGNNRLTLSGVNTYSGTTTIQAGAILARGGSALSDTSAVVIVHNTSAATILDLNGYTERIGSLSGGGYNSNVTTYSGGGLIVGDASSTVYAGAYGGGGAITKVGSGSLQFTGVGGWTSAIYVNQGTLAVNSVGIDNEAAVYLAAGTTLIATGSTHVGSLTGAVGSQVVLSGQMMIGYNNLSTTFAGNISGTGGIYKWGTGTTTLSGVNTFSGNTSITTGTLRLGSGAGIGDASSVIMSNSGTLDLNGADETIGSLQTAGSVLLGSKTLTLGGNNTTTSFSGVFSGTGSINKVGTGNFTISGANSFIGAAKVSGGTLTLGANEVLAGSVEVAGGTLAVGTRTETVTGVTLTSGSITGSTGVLTSLSNYNIQSGTITAKLGGSVGLVKTGAGTATLTGVSSFTGGVTVSDGTLTLGASNVVSGSLLVNGGNFSIGSFAETMSSVTLAGGAISGTTGTLISTTDYDVQSGTVSAQLGGSVGLTKSGAGTVVLSANNVYTGATTVNAGTLIVNGSQPGGTFQVNDGAIGGSGTIGTLTVANGAVNPGASLGVLTVNGPVSLSSTSTFAVDIVGASGPGSAYDQLASAGHIDISNAVLSVNLGYTPTLGSTFVIIRNDGVDPVVGEFINSVPGWSIHYNGGDGNDVTIEYMIDHFVPAPMPVALVTPPASSPSAATLSSPTAGLLTASATRSSGFDSGATSAGQGLFSNLGPQSFREQDSFEQRYWTSSVSSSIGALMREVDSALAGVTSGNAPIARALAPIVVREIADGLASGATSKTIAETIVKQFPQLNAVKLTEVVNDASSRFISQRAAAITLNGSLAKASNDVIVRALQREFPGLDRSCAERLVETAKKQFEQRTPQPSTPTPAPKQDVPTDDKKSSATGAVQSTLAAAAVHSDSSVSADDLPVAAYIEGGDDRPTFHAIGNRPREATEVNDAARRSDPVEQLLDVIRELFA